MSWMSHSYTWHTNQTAWVECERCKKWRKLPDFVDPEQLPEQWYCEMNVWDRERSTCNAPEERYVESTAASSTGGGGGRGSGGGSSILGGGSGRFSNKLSWRDMIFGADGRVKSQFAERGTQSSSVFTALNSRDQAYGKEGVFIRSSCYKAPASSRLAAMTALPSQGLLEGARRVYSRATKGAWTAIGPSSEMAEAVGSHERIALVCIHVSSVRAMDANNSFFFWFLLR